MNGSMTITLPLSLVIFTAACPNHCSSTAAAGTAIEAAEQLVVATGSGALSLEELQPAGKRVLSAAEFLRGYRVQVGDRFGLA